MPQFLDNGKRLYSNYKNEDKEHYMKPKLIILLDAFGEEYYNKSNYLKELGHKKHIETIFGYQSGYDSFLSGKYPSDSNVWFNFIMKDEGMYENTKFMMPVIKQIRKFSPSIINSGIPFLYSKLFGTTNLYKIPQCLHMDYFCNIDQLIGQHATNSKYPGSNIFSYLRDKNIQYKFIISNVMFDKNGYKIFYWKKGNDDTAKDIFIKNLDKDTQFYFIHLTELDKIGHEYVYNHQVQEIISKEEDMIRNIIESFLKIFPHGEYFIFGDHGMAQVTNNINPYNIIDSIKDMDREFSYFIDSTFLRIYFSNKKNVDYIEDILKDNFAHDVIFVDNIISKKYKVPKDAIYGDIIISVKPYEIFYPNFFNDHLINGMHGYIPDIPEAPGCIISNVDIEEEFVTIPTFQNFIRKGL